MSVTKAVLALTAFGKNRGVSPVAGKTLAKATGVFDDEIQYFPDAQHGQAWIDRIDNGRKSSIGLNFISGELTYGYQLFKHDRSRIERHRV